MKKHLLTLLFLLWGSVMLNGQTTADSLTIVSARWTVTPVQKGIVYKQVSLPMLYQTPQTISIVEVDMRTRKKMGIAISDKMKETSLIATENNAIAAMNGSYFDMKRGNSTCFLKVNEQIVDTTRNGEFKLRVTGAVRTHKGKMEILSWNKETEKKYKGRRGTVLASGPLMLKDGRTCDWSVCSPQFIETKHPRSAICITGDRKVLLITVDGRLADRAGGVNIPELAHLIRILGGKDAINLDGGGSTTLWGVRASEKGVLNYPCDNRTFDHQGERKVANILYVYD